MTQPLTCDDLWRNREASAERLEIVDGELFITPPLTPRHQIVLGRISVTFDRVVGDGKLGEILAAMLDVRLSQDTVVLPDIMVILRDRYRMVTDWGIDGPPSLLAEIASGDLRPDLRARGIKKEIYALYGVPEYWLVEPEKHRVSVQSLAQVAGSASRGRTAPLPPAVRR